MNVHLLRVKKFTLCINTDNPTLIIASAQKSHDLPRGPPPPPIFHYWEALGGVHVQKNIDESNIDQRKTPTTHPTPTLA